MIIGTQELRRVAMSRRGLPPLPARVLTIAELFGES